MEWSNPRNPSALLLKSCVVDGKCGFKLSQSLNRTSNVVVDVSVEPGRVLSSQVIENVQPAWIEEEYSLIEKVWIALDRLQPSSV